KARPAADVLDDGVRFIVEVDLPGVNKQDVDVRVIDGGRALTISGAQPVHEHEEGWVNEPEESHTWVQRERPLGGGARAFETTVWFPEAVESGQIEAEMSDGLLVVTASKAKKEEGVKITV
ncbi:HSP20-like chaperone, partial [Vararia minispora EC-137]